MSQGKLLVSIYFKIEQQIIHICFFLPINEFLVHPIVVQPVVKPVVVQIVVQPVVWQPVVVYSVVVLLDVGQCVVM